jgi:hypothetical protein
MSGNSPARKKSLLAAATLGLLIAVPSSLGMAFFVFPSAPPVSRWITVARLEDVPESGAPRLLKANVPRENAWQLEAGIAQTIYVQRSDADITAFHSYFHHDLRLPIVYDADRDVFKTMCWNLEFSRDGNSLNNQAAQPASLHRVETKVEDGEILVRF